MRHPRATAAIVAVSVAALAAVSTQTHTHSTAQTTTTTTILAVDTDDADPPTITVPGQPATTVVITVGNRPDVALTPGAVFPDVTAAQVCVPGYSKSVRNVPQSEKDQVYAEYNVTSHPTGAYEVDHLISLELGGSNDIRNLWPEPYTGPDNAHVKDGLENHFHSMVCNGEISLTEAQARIVHWWDYEE